MKHKTKGRVPTAIPLLFAMLLLASVVTTSLVIRANDKTQITYEFTGNDAGKAGYAEGSLSLYAKEAGTYYLYWADDTKALEDYYAIGDISDTTTNDSSCDLVKKQAYFQNMKAGESRTFPFASHTAIPAGATKIIATTDQSNATVDGAAAVFDIPTEKQLYTGSGHLLYTFNSYSDIHIDTEGYYQKSLKNWEKALKFAKKTDTDFIISSGDAVTNSKGSSSSKGGFADEWKTYQDILADSDYCNPVYESDGNHDMRTENSGLMDNSGTYKGITGFVKASGTDSTVANIEKNKPYYYVIEKTTGDVFIFMAMENGYDAAGYDNFSEEQINWLKDLLDTYYGTGVNVYIIEHAPFRGYGAGDTWMTPLSNGYIPSHYKAFMLVNGQTGKKNSNEYFTAEGMDGNTEFQQLLEQYPDLIWMSGHSHQDFTTCINYSNENGTSCHMIHNPSVAATTYYTDATSESQEYDSNTKDSDGLGRTSQGYYVETYENTVIYYGANLYDAKIYPAYCYIMEGSRNAASVATTDQRQVRIPTYETFSVDKELISSNATLSDALTVAKELLDTYHTLSTYDPYQALKKHYYACQNNATLADSAQAVANLKETAEQLYGLANRLNQVSAKRLSISSSSDNTSTAPVIQAFDWKPQAVWRKADTTQDALVHEPIVDDTITWDCVYFGSYPQQEVTEATDPNTYKLLQNATDWAADDTLLLGNTKYKRIPKEDATGTGAAYNQNTANAYHYFQFQPIKWRVLHVSEGQAYLISELALDTKKYNEEARAVSWDTCSLRSWLNGYDATQNQPRIDYRSQNFLNTAFNDAEKNALISTVSDAVTILSEETVNNTTNRQWNLRNHNTCKASDYAQAMGAHSDAKGICNWWTLSNGNSGLTAQYVQPSGACYQKGYSIAYRGNALRVAIALDLQKADTWQYAGTVSSDGTVTEPQPTSPSCTTVCPATNPAYTTAPGTTAPVTIVPTTTDTIATTTEKPGTPTPATHRPVISSVPHRTAVPSPTYKNTLAPAVSPVTDQTAAPSVTPGNQSATPVAKATTAPDRTPIITPTTIPAPVQPTATAAPADTLKKNDLRRDTTSNGIYRILQKKTSVGADGTIGTVAYVGAINKNRKRVSIPATVTIENQSFRVTTVAKGAFCGNKHLKTLILGKNIQKINANAWKGCKNLEQITVRTTRLNKSSIGRQAFRKISATVSIQVPDGKLKKYKQYFRKAGVSKTALFF